MKAKRPAASIFVVMKSNEVDSTVSIRPNIRASFDERRPEGRGRLEVRDMTASVSASYHMFNAPAAPAPTAIAITANVAETKCKLPLAVIIPTIAVNTARDITLGFAKAKKSGALAK